MLEDIIQKANADLEVKEGDYYEDGLLHCGVCGWKKQTRINFGGKSRIVRCTCYCQEKAYYAARDAERESQRRLDRERARSSGFPDRAMMEWTFDADDGANPEFTAICKRYVEGFDDVYREGKGLLFYGGVGTGKTFMASCIANALIDKGNTALVTNFGRIANELQADFNHRQAYLDKLNQYSLLVIDDLATERDTEYMGEIVMNVIDSRYRAKKPLIVTTNLTGEDFTNPSDVRRQRVFSRLFEMCIPYEVKGTDRRQKTLASDIEKYSWLFGKE